MDWWEEEQERRREEDRLRCYLKRKTCSGDMWAMMERIKENLAPVRSDIRVVLEGHPLQSHEPSEDSKAACRSYLKSFTKSRDMLNELIEDLQILQRERMAEHPTKQEPLPGLALRQLERRP
jgi:hypothetical protein